MNGREIIHEIKQVIRMKQDKKHSFDLKETNNVDANINID